MPNVGLVVFAFGCPSMIYSNTVLAASAEKWSNECGGPIYTQEDVNLNSRLINQVQYIRQLTNKPPPTLKIAREALHWARDQHLDELHILAAAPHLPRCMRDMAIAKQEQYSLMSLYESSYAKDIPFEQWFCPDSTQPRTRSFHAWEGRERIVRNLPVWLYKLVAS